MRRTFLIFVVLIFTLPLELWSQQPQDISSLLAQLNQANTTDRAKRLILQAASQDHSVRQQVAGKAVAMIDKPEVNEIWLNAVRLSGELRLLEALPSLQKAFLRGQLGAPAVTTFGTQMMLNDDVVAKALSEIGDPSIPAVRGFLQSDDSKTRRRAILILMNINSSESRNLLKEHLPSETDSRIIGLIKNWQDNVRP